MLSLGEQAFKFARCPRIGVICDDQPINRGIVDDMGRAVTPYHSEDQKYSCNVGTRFQHAQK